MELPRGGIQENFLMLQIRDQRTDYKLKIKVIVGCMSAAVLTDTASAMYKIGL